MMTPLSKILRIDPNEEEGGYSVPTDNPFYGQVCVSPCVCVRAWLGGGGLIF